MLEYFVVVADCLNISDASRKLFVSQPAISRQIIALENELGAKLFHRTKPYLTLTEVGMQLKKQIEKIVDMSNELVHQAQAISGNVTGKLTVGYSDHLERSYLFHVLTEMSSRFPNISYYFLSGPLNYLSRELENGTLDIAFCPLTNLMKISDVEYHVINRCKRVLACSENHPLASRESVVLEDIASEKLVTFRRRDSIYHSDQIIAECKKCGFTPKIDYEVPDITSFLLTIVSNMAVGLVGCDVEPLIPSGVRLIPFSTVSEPLLIGAGWRSDNQVPALQAMKDILKELYPL